MRHIFGNLGPNVAYVYEEKSNTVIWNIYEERCPGDLTPLRDSKMDVIAFA